MLLAMGFSARAVDEALRATGGDSQEALLRLTEEVHDPASAHKPNAPSDFNFDPRTTLSGPYLQGQQMFASNGKGSKSGKGKGPKGKGLPPTGRRTAVTYGQAGSDGGSLWGWCQTGDPLHGCRLSL